jgi:hypothetical protein
MNARENTARCRALGAELRKWRERAQLRGVDLAQWLSWSASKIANMEAGRRGVSEVDAAMYLGCCRAPGESTKRILEFFHAQQEFWLQPNGTKLPDQLLSLITFETTASAIHTFELALIPGLLQTEDYARAVIANSLTPENAIETRVRARKDRQALLRREYPPNCLFYIHENAFRLPVGGDAVMNDQLLHLVFASTRPHIKIRVVPSAAGPVPGMGCSYALMEYAKDNKPVVRTANAVATVFLDGPAEVRVHRELLTGLAGAALDETQSRDWIAHRANEHDRPREGHNEHAHVGEPPMA